MRRGKLFCSLTRLVFSTCLVICTLSTSLYAQSGLTWQIFGDFSAKYEHLEAQSATFEVGDLDFWFKHRFSEKWSGMGEVMLMNMNEAGDPNYHVHPARLFLDYAYSDIFQLRIGQIHTPIGWYSQLYPHGARFFEPTIHRPKLALVEHGKEFLPLHSVGVSARGEIELSSTLNLNYIMGVGNGGGHGGLDDNHWKSPFLNVNIQPLAIDGLSMGVSFLLDRLSTLHNAEVKELDQFISNAYIHYDLFPFELLAEVFWMRHGHLGDSGSRHQPSSASSDMQSYRNHTMNSSLLGGYLQASYLFDKHALFTVFEIFERDPDDLILNAHTPYTEYIGVHWGYRYHINPHLVLKAGHRYEWPDRVNQFDLQLAYWL